MLKDQSFYWVKVKGKDDWEIARASATKRMGFLPETFELQCIDSGYIDPDNAEKLIEIIREEAPCDTTPSTNSTSSE